MSAIEYKLNQTSRWVYFYKILLQTIFLTIFASYLSFEYYGLENNILLTYLLGGVLPWFLIFGLPLLLLYFIHLKHSKNLVFKQNGNLFHYSNHFQSVEFYLDDIKEIELWLTPPAYDKRIDWQFFGKYHFTKIHTKQNQIINISCLVFDKTKETFPKELISRKKKLLPFVGVNKL